MFLTALLTMTDILFKITYGFMHLWKECVICIVAFETFFFPVDDILFQVLPRWKFLFGFYFFALQAGNNKHQTIVIEIRSDNATNAQPCACKFALQQSLTHLAVTYTLSL